MYGDVGGMSSGASSGGSDGSSSGEESENESLWQAPPLSTGALAPASASLPRSIALPSPTRYSRALRPMYLLSSAAPVPAGALKRRLLAAGGWRVVSVPLMEWRALPLPQQHQPRGGALDHSRVPARSRYTGGAGSSGSREVNRAAETWAADERAGAENAGADTREEDSGWAASLDCASPPPTAAHAPPLWFEDGGDDAASSAGSSGAPAPPAWYLQVLAGVAEASDAQLAALLPPHQAQLRGVVGRAQLLFLAGRLLLLAPRPPSSASP